jgi:hypothetical protein
LTWLPGRDRDRAAASRLHGIRRLRDQAARSWPESAAARELRGSLISLAALLDTGVKDPTGATVGRVRDVIVHWTTTAAYPPVTAVVVRTGRHDVTIGARWIEASGSSNVALRSSAAYARSAELRPSEVALARDVLDRQIVGADGADILRPADVYLASVGGQVELVGIEVGPRALLRRLGPKRLRAHFRPERVIDWATVRCFTPALSESASSRGRRSDLAGRAGTQLELDVTGQDSRALRASEVRSALQDSEDGRDGAAS